ncbi:MAG: hypothetical protein DRH08_00315 [Deltaproteobacteria bacterium]|nr:MAG: hypothetical protein DRH08_00315 [Deltaproteobacteria bacterium]
MKSDPHIDRGADISECGKYRYRLWRMWDDGKEGLLGFIMLNPSTADADTDDPTIRKCIGFARRFGYDGIMVTNLFAFRATNPAELKTAYEPVGRDNHVFLETEAKTCDRTICAWGTNGALKKRGEVVIEKLRKQDGAPRLRHLGLTKDGHPRHPLYLPYAETDMQLFSFQRGL